MRKHSEVSFIFFFKHFLLELPPYRQTRIHTCSTALARSHIPRRKPSPFVCIYFGLPGLILLHFTSPIGSSTRFTTVKSSDREDLLFATPSAHSWQYRSHSCRKELTKFSGFKETSAGCTFSLLFSAFTCDFWKDRRERSNSSYNEGSFRWHYCGFHQAIQTMLQPGRLAVISWSPFSSCTPCEPEWAQCRPLLHSGRCCIRKPKSHIVLLCW